MRVFGRVRFGQRDDVVVYDNATLQIPFISADPALLAVFEGNAARTLSDLVAQVSMAITAGDVIRITADNALTIDGIVDAADLSLLLGAWTG